MRSRMFCMPLPDRTRKPGEGVVDIRPERLVADSELVDSHEQPDRGCHPANAVAGTAGDNKRTNEHEGQGIERATANPPAVDDLQDLWRNESGRRRAPEGIAGDEQGDRGDDAGLRQPVRAPPKCEPHALNTAYGSGAARVAGRP